jgi:hypothetical protein
MTHALDETHLPPCRRCGRETGLSGGVCAFCMAAAVSPDQVPWTEEETKELDFALCVLHWQALKEGWKGKKPDDRPLARQPKVKRRT